MDDDKDDTYSAVYMSLVLIAKLNGLVSILGSSCILYDLLWIKKRQRSSPRRSPQQRQRRRSSCSGNTNSSSTKDDDSWSPIILCLSISDILSSLIAHVIGSFLVPQGTVYGSYGTITTCTISGYIATAVSAMSILFNVVLSTWFVMIVRYQWSKQRLQKLQPILLLIAVLLPPILGIPALYYQSFNWSGGWACTMNASPHGCNEKDSTVECIRGGSYTGILRMCTVVLPFMISGIFIVGSMFVLYWTVLQQEKQTDQYTNTEGFRSRKQSKRVAKQGMWFVGAFILTYIFYIISMIIDKDPIWLRIIAGFFLPLQGFFNALVYFRPRYLSHQRRLKRDAQRRRQRLHLQQDQQQQQQLQDNFINNDDVDVTTSTQQQELKQEDILSSLAMIDTAGRVYTNDTESITERTSGTLVSPWNNNNPNNNGNDSGNDNGESQLDTSHSSHFDEEEFPGSNNHNNNTRVVIPYDERQAY